MTRSNIHALLLFAALVLVAVTAAHAGGGA